MQMLGYPLSDHQQDLTMRQRAFLLLACPDPMGKPNGGKQQRSGNPRNAQRELLRKIQQRRKQQRKLR